MHKSAGFEPIPCGAANMDHGHAPPSPVKHAPGEYLNGVVVGVVEHLDLQ
jgi:hypothetical protein